MSKVIDLRPPPKEAKILQGLPGGTFYTPAEGFENEGEVFVLTNEEDDNGRRVSVWVGSLTGNRDFITYQNDLNNYFYIGSLEKGYVLNVEIMVKP